MPFLLVGKAQWLICLIILTTAFLLSSKKQIHEYSRWSFHGIAWASSAFSLSGESSSTQGHWIKSPSTTSLHGLLSHTLHKFFQLFKHFFFVILISSYFIIFKITRKNEKKCAVNTYRLSNFIIREHKFSSKEVGAVTPRWRGIWTHFHHGTCLKRWPELTPLKKIS